MFNIKENINSLEIIVFCIKCLNNTVYINNCYSNVIKFGFIKNQIANTNIVLTYMKLYLKISFILSYLIFR